MMRSELLLLTWPNFNFSCSNLDQSTSFDQEYGFHGTDFSDSFASPEESSVISSNSYVQAMFADVFPYPYDQIQICSEISEWTHGSETERNSSSPLTIEGDEFSPCLSFESNHNSSVFSLTDMSLMLPAESVEVDCQLTLLHLLRAYGEAMENGEKELAEVIINSINEKSSPVGNTTERVAYNLFQSREKQGRHLREESRKNLLQGFKLLYQSLPNGRFAHFTANSAILEAMPNEAETLHVVDFEIGEGIQWPTLIEALSRKHKGMKLTSVRSEGESTSSYWSFEDTKKRLLDHSRLYGVELQIEEKSIEDFSIDLWMKRRGQGREWLVFNCMVGLPHTGRRRSRKSIDEFSKVAKESLARFEGIMIIGEGEAKESLNSSCGYALYFDNLVKHYQAVFESLERNFPAYLAEARTAMESLFIAPFMCPLAWFQEWDEMKKSYRLQTEPRFEGRKMSLESLIEAKAMVSEGESCYSVRIEGMRVHEMVLHWKETPLVRVSTWM